MPALFIGRFQPFHLGHLDAIKKALPQTEMLFIGIGSTQENYLPENPFTAGERIEMIKAALDEAKIDPSKYLIIPIPNINNYELWPHHVEQYLPPFEEIYTGSEIVKTLFERANSKLKNPHKAIKVEKKLNISSTKIREAMKQNESWQKMVPASVAQLLKAWNAEKRLKSINF
jgi:nicotinamide-nucleotide adenylyltransferase